MILAHDRRGATPSDVLVFLATVSLAGALLYPAWHARGFRNLVERAVGDVEVLARAARSTLGASGAWPSASAPGEAPPEMFGLSGEGQPFGRLEYRMGWTSWNVVDSIDVQVDILFAPGDAPPDSAGPVREPIVRTIGGVAVYSGDPSLLAELAERFSGETSFVLDSMWVLVLPERADRQAAAP